MSDSFQDAFVHNWERAGPGEGIDQDLARAKGEDLLMIMDARGLKTSQAQREQVMASTDPSRLDLWLDRALTADSADEVFRR